MHSLWLCMIVAIPQRTEVKGMSKFCWEEITFVVIVSVFVYFMGTLSIFTSTDELPADWRQQLQEVGLLKGE